MIEIQQGKHILIGPEHPTVALLRARLHSDKLIVVQYVQTGRFGVADQFDHQIREYRMLDHFPVVTEEDWEHLYSQFYTTPAMQKQWEKESSRELRQFAIEKEADGRRFRGIMRAVGKKVRGLRKNAPIYHARIPGD